MIHPERDDWARQLTALRQQMAEQAASLDASGEFPWRNIDHLRAGGWLSLAVPPSCGGAGASLAQLQQVIAAIAWGEPATALIVCMQYLHHLRLAENDAWHAPLRQQVFHDAVEHGGLINSLRVEPELGSPARGGLPDTVATRRAEGWDISGHKIYTTGIEGLRWLAVWARSDDNPPLVGTWLVPGDSPGITVVKSWDHAGMRATGSHEVIFNHVRVAAEHAVDVWPADAPPAAEAEPFRLFANRQTALLAAIYDSIAHAAHDCPLSLTETGILAVVIVIFVLLLIITSMLFLLRYMVHEEEKLTKKAEYDALTGIPNRFFMMDEIQKLFIENGQKDYYLAMIDIDNFKNINDTYGHNTGDDALKILAKTIILQAQKHGFKYCRWGGEEFLLLGKCRSGEIPKDILEELRSAISSNCVRTSRESFRYTVTIGAGKYTSGQSAKEWLDFVDKQLYKGKRSGKNQVVCS